MANVKIMKKSELRKTIKEEISKVLKENIEDGSQYHIDQIDDDLMHGEFSTLEDVDTYLDNIIKGIERLRIEKRENVRAINFGNGGSDEMSYDDDHFPI